VRGRLSGKVALITGGGNGQGAAEARLFVAEEASVVVADLDDEAAAAVVADLRAAGGQAMAVHLDISDADEWASAVEATVDRFGQLDILVNNAAIFLGEGRIDAVSDEDWHRMFAVNSTGPFFGIRACVPAMRSSGGGSIVNIATTNALHGSNLTPAYGASKAAVINLTMSAAVQYGPDGIRANVILPGPTDTAMLRGFMGEAADKAADLLPLRRLGQPADIANGVVFLASDDAAWITGAQLNIDGGLRA